MLSRISHGAYTVDNVATLFRQTKMLTVNSRECLTGWGKGFARQFDVL